MVVVVVAVASRSGVSLFPGKAADQAPLAATKGVERENRGPLSEVSPFGRAVVPRDRLEAFLKAKGRSGANVLAVWLIDLNEPYGSELLAMNHDPVALSLLAFAGHAEQVEQFHRIAPENAYAELLILMFPMRKNGGGTLHLDMDTGRCLAMAALKPEFQTYEREIETAMLDLQCFLQGDVREGWKERCDDAIGPGEYRPEHITLMENFNWCHMIGKALDQEKDGEKRQSLIDNALRVAALAEEVRFDEESRDYATELRSIVFQSLTPEEMRQKTGMTQEEWETSNDSAAMDAAAAERAQMFRSALDIASGEQIAEMDRLYREEGLKAAKQFLIESVGEEALKRRIEEQ